MRDPVHTEELHGLTINVWADHEEHNDPRDWDNVGRMLCWHPHYRLGDEQFHSPEDVGGARSMQEVGEYLVRERGAFVMLPLFLLDHSGISMSYGSPIRTEGPTAEDVRAAGRFVGDGAGWDTSAVGFIYATRDSFAAMCGDADPWEIIEAERERPYLRGGKHTERIPRIIAILQGEVETYDQFLTGDVYGYTIEGLLPIEDARQYETSLWGIFGWSDAQEEARTAVRAIRPIDPEARFTIEAVGL